MTAKANLAANDNAVVITRYLATTKIAALCVVCLCVGVDTQWCVLTQGMCEASSAVVMRCCML